MKTDMNPLSRKMTTPDLTKDGVNHQLSSKTTIPPLATLVRPWRKVLINLFWAEKVLLLVDFLQVYGVIWICAQPWPWPYLWVSWTRWSVAFNVDAFSLTPNGALAGRTNNIGVSKYGNMSGYLYYTVGFALFELLLGIALVFLLWKTNSYATRLDKMKPLLKELAAFVGMVFFLPCTLTLSRLFVCDQNGKLSADPNVHCGGVEHLVVIVFCLAIYLPLVYQLFRHIHSSIKLACVYDLSVDHEKRMQMWEIEYLLGVDDNYLHNHCWMLASFRRDAALFRYHLMILKGALVVVFAGFRSSASLQALLCLVLIFTYFGYYGLWMKSFRCSISNIMMTAISVVLIVDSSFGLANSLKLENFLMVASTESLFLLCSNGLCACAMVGSLLYGLMANTLGAQWPPLVTLGRISHDRKMNGICVQWVECLRKATILQIASRRASPALLDIDGLEQCIRDLRSAWLGASTFGSIFTISLGDMLEELLHLHSYVKQSSLRNISHWDDAYVELSIDQRFQQRHAHTFLMSDRKRRILTKLLVMRTFMSKNTANTDIHYSTKSDQRYNASHGEDIDSRWLADIVSHIDSLTGATNAIIHKQVHEIGFGEVVDLISSWDDVISIFEEDEKLGGMFNAVTVENWYTYRGALMSLKREFGDTNIHGEQVEQVGEDHADSEQDDELDRLLGLQPGWNAVQFRGDSSV